MGMGVDGCGGSLRRSWDANDTYLMCVYCDRSLLTDLRGSAHVSRVNSVSMLRAKHLAMKQESRELSAFWWS